MKAKKKDRRIFKKTANLTRTINVMPSKKRGGECL